MPVGFGLTPDDGGPEVFVHRTDLNSSLHILLTDQRVSYDLVDSGNKKGTGKKAVEAAADDTVHTSLYIPGPAFEKLREIAFLQRRKMHDLILDGVDAVLKQHGHAPTERRKRGHVIGAAVMVGRIATGEIEDITTEDGKNAAAVALGRMGGKARAEGMTAKRRKEIARKAAKTRWKRPK